MIRLLTPADYRVMPWKNGGGTTTEIHIHPEGAGWDGFAWRAGIADITQSGPFSSFPGIDRSIMLLERPDSSGMRLTIDGRGVDLPLHEFVDFAGESTTFGTLLGKPVRDFNVMSRRGRVRHTCGFRQLAADEVFELVDGLFSLVYFVSGAGSVPDRDRLQPRFQPIPSGCSLLRDAETVLRVVAGDAGCELVWVTGS